MQLVNVQISQVEPLVSGLSSFKPTQDPDPCSTITLNLSLRNMHVYLFFLEFSVKLFVLVTDLIKCEAFTGHEVIMIWLGGEYGAGFGHGDMSDYVHQKLFNSSSLFVVG